MSDITDDILDEEDDEDVLGYCPNDLLGRMIATGLRAGYEPATVVTSPDIARAAGWDHIASKDDSGNLYLMGMRLVLVRRCVLLAFPPGDVDNSYVDGSQLFTLVDAPDGPLLVPIEVS